METSISPIYIKNFSTESGVTIASIPLTFTHTGLALDEAPIVLVNHALTGNAEVAGPTGWWSDLIGDHKTIDITKYAILAFNVPGNGADSFIIDNYQDFTARDIAKIFLLGLAELKCQQLYAIIGGSVGGGIAWEMLALSPNITKKIIPIATDWKATDWMIANCYLQERILNNSNHPLEDARIHAMLCYRTPESFTQKFNREIQPGNELFKIESWLDHHGEKLQRRFQLASYKLMNQLLKTLDITRNTENLETLIARSSADIYIIGINSDQFFTADQNKQTYNQLKLVKNNVFYKEIDSIHGHDAFLIEYKQLDYLLADIF